MMGTAGIIAVVALTFWALTASAKKKIADPDPLAGLRKAELGMSKSAAEERITRGLNIHSGGLGNVKFVMTPEMERRLERAMSPKFYYFVRSRRTARITRMAGPFYSQKEFREWWMPRYGPSGPQLPWDAEKAADMAYDVAMHIRQYRGWYVPEYVAQFQRYAGLTGARGVADGLYGGRTMGALCHFITMKTGKCEEALLPTPIYEPTWMVKYHPPQSRQV